VQDAQPSELAIDANAAFDEESAQRQRRVRMSAGDGEWPDEAKVRAFVEKIVLNADRITAADIEVLRSHGYRDEDIFDVAATAAARCFFSKLLDALGVQADSTFNELDPALRRALTVGRPVADRPE